MKTGFKKRSMLVTVLLTLTLMMSTSAFAGTAVGSKYIQYKTAYLGYSIDFYCNNDWRETSYLDMNGGYETYVQKAGDTSTKSKLCEYDTFRFGKEYAISTVEGLYCSILASVPTDGEEATFTYTLRNESEAALKIQLGTCVTPCIGDNAVAPEISIQDNTTIVTKDINTNSETLGAQFLIKGGSASPFNTIWYGKVKDTEDASSSTYQNHVFDSYDSTFTFKDGDEKAMAWSWIVTVPADDTRSVTMVAGAKIPKAQTITAEDVTVYYGDDGAKVSAASDGDGALSYAVKSGSDVVDVDASTGALTMKKPGSAVVTVTAAETSNYKAAEKDVNVTVGKGTQVIDTEETITTQLGSIGAMVAATSSGDGTISFAVQSGGSVLSVEEQSGLLSLKSAGEAVVRVTASETDLYKAAYTDVNVTVKQSENIPYISITKAKNTGKKIALAWKKVKGAEGYDVFISYCSKKLPSKATKSVKGTTATISTLGGKSLKQDTSFQYVVKAYVKNGKEKTYIATMPSGHIPGTKMTGYTNIKKITSSTSSYTLVKGNRMLLKCSLTKEKTGKKILDHVAKYRYYSANKLVVRVSKKGSVKAVGKGTCKVYVYSESGLTKEITFKVP